MGIGQKIKELRERQGITQKQLADALGISSKTIGHYETDRIMPSVEVLKKIADFFGVPVDYFFKSNEIEIISEHGTKRIPIYSAPVSAGFGVYPDEVYLQGYIVVPHQLADFAVRVIGDSMAPVAPEGSILLVKKTLMPLNGDMVVATYDGWVYVKWYIKQGDTILLVSENTKYAPIIVSEKERFIVHGVVVDVMTGKPRKYLGGM